MVGVMNYNNINMTEYYKECLEKGLKYQDFITEILLIELGICLSSYASKKYQQCKGENIQGFEIKFDDKFKETGNIYIEVKEKSNSNNENYVKSGIYRNDNTWLYLIGNYNTLYIFSKSHLKLMHEKKKYEEKIIPTSKGFIIPEIDCDKYCIKKINIK